MRRKFQSILRRYLRSLLPAIVAVGALISLCAATAAHAQTSLLVFISLIVIGNAFLLGYSTRMRQQYPHLREYRRSDYAAVWNELSFGEKEAFVVATGEVGEESLRREGTRVAARIISHLPLKKTDDVLEIGCGVGRIGWAMAPLCHTWTGADISKNMLRHAKTRLTIFPNVGFVQLAGVGLQEIPSDSIDVVYCTNVLPHLSETDRWWYVADAHRVLRPGGTVYLDTIALDSTEGWAMLKNNLHQRQIGKQVPYEPVPSTAEEFVTYLKCAGFGDVRVKSEGSLLILIGAKETRPRGLTTSAPLAEIAIP